MDLTPPQVMVTAEDVEVGKPNPACYLLGRDRIGLGSSSRSGPGPGSGSFSRPRSGQKQHLNQTQKQTQTQMQTQIQTQTQTQAAPSTSPLLSASISPSASHSFVPSILVLEDAPSGIRAGKAAGCTVIGVGTTHGLEDLIGAGVDYVVRDLTSVRILGVDRLVGQGAEDQVKVEIEIEISELLYAGAGILL